MLLLMHELKELRALCWTSAQTESFALYTSAQAESLALYTVHKLKALHCTQVHKLKALLCTSVRSGFNVTVILRYYTVILP